MVYALQLGRRPARRCRRPYLGLGLLCVAGTILLQIRGSHHVSHGSNHGSQATLPTEGVYSVMGYNHCQAPSPAWFPLGSGAGKFSTTHNFEVTGNFLLSYSEPQPVLTSELFDTPYEDEVSRQASRSRPSPFLYP